jgi:hypothetical protein
MAGDMWDHTAVTAESRLVVSVVGGKRPHAQPRAFVYDAKRRLRPGPLPAMFTAAYTSSEGAILEAFGRRYPTPAAPGTRPGSAFCPPLAARRGLWAGEKTRSEGAGGADRSARPP